MQFILGRVALHFVWKSILKYFQIEERYIMKMKQKLHKYRIREINKINSILHTLRSTARKNETYLRYSFFDSAKFV